MVMLKANMKYGALKTKVLVMYSRSLKSTDFEKLYECGNIGEITTYLHSHKGYSKLISDLPLRPTVENYKKALKKQEQNDFEKLYKFLSVEDKKCLIFVMYRADFDCVLSVLRKLYSPSDDYPLSDLPEFTLKHCNVDIDRLSESSNFQGLLDAVKGSIFEKPLSMLRINPDTGLPDYTEVSVVMENTLYKAAFDYSKRLYSGMSASKLSKLIGTEADIVNIMHILRIRRYFPSSLESFEDLLIPVKNHLNSQLIYSMKAARTEDETIEILNKSRCSGYFEGFNPTNIDNLFENAMGQFCSKLIRMPEPCIVVPIAYLILKSIENKKLLQIIEAVSYGLDPKKNL